MTPTAAAAPDKSFAPPPTEAGPVIVAVGGTDASGVLRAAQYFASASTGGVLAVSVLEPFPVYCANEPMILPPEFEAERAAARLASLDKQITDGAPHTAGWHTELLYGEPSHAIAEMARARHSPVIVMGLGRHSPLDRLLGVETTLRTIRGASCAVLAVSPDVKPPFREAVVATDFSPSSAKAAESIIPLLTDGSVLHLVHVWQPSATHDARLRALDEAYVRSLPNKFRRLREIIAAPSRVVVKEEVREGSVAERVLDYANAHHADVIVVGRHGRSLLARLVVGSVTSALLRGTTCSVLIAHEPMLADLDRIRRLLTGTSESRTPAEWVIQLDEFTRRNRGRRTVVEVDDVSFGAQVLESGYAFQGATYDRHDRRVELMLGDADGSTRHVTRGIAHVDSIAVATDQKGKDSGLRISHEPGQTVLTFASG